MLDLLLAGAIILMLVAYGIWKAFNSGELRQIVDFISMASQMDNDLFGGETREFVLNVEGVDRTVGIKTGQDIHDRVFERIESGICILSTSEQRIEGLHLVFRFQRKHGDDVLNLTERNGERVVDTTEYNLDTNPVPLINHLTDLVRRMGTSQSAEVEPMDEQTAATASAWGVISQD
jgi:hypothetical protein